MYKIYTSIVSERIVKWTDARDLIVEEQNGFRHISSLTNIINIRRKVSNLLILPS
jgi:hypothetical protein